MSADAGYGPKPTNQILVAGKPLVQILKVRTSANCYPGRLVMKDTTDGQIKVSDGTQFVGWLGYEQTIKKHRPVDPTTGVATVDTVYPDNAHAAVLNGGGFVIVASILNGTVVKGELLKGVAAGQVSGGVAGTNFIVAIAEQGATGPSDIMVRSLI